MSERKFAKARFTPESNEHDVHTAVAMTGRLLWRRAKTEAHDARKLGFSTQMAVRTMRDAFITTRFASQLMTERWNRLLGGVG